MAWQLGLKHRAADWDRQFTFKVWQLTPEDAKARVAAAWLAGYNACLKNARDKRTTKNRSVKPRVGSVSPRCRLVLSETEC